MNTLKFKHLVNDQNKMQKLQSQQSFGRKKTENNSTIPEIKKQIKEALRSSQMKKIPKKYSSYVSLLQSNISMISNPNLPPDLVFSLLQVEQNVSQQILALRQDKITLMSEYNQIIQNRYRIQKQLAKIKKDQNKEKMKKIDNQNENGNSKEKLKQQGEVNQISVFPNYKSTSHMIVDENDLQIKISSSDNLRDRPTKSIVTDTQRQSQDMLLSQIEKLQESSRVIEQKITQIENNTDRYAGQDRLQNFIHKKSYSTDSNFQILQKLRKKRDSLYTNLADRTPNYNQRMQFYQLIHQNRELLRRRQTIVSKDTIKGSSGQEKASTMFRYASYF